MNNSSKSNASVNINSVVICIRKYKQYRDICASISIKRIEYYIQTLDQYI